MQLTKFQKLTAILLFLYILWEIVVQIWSQSEKTPVIRADLFFIYPILSICIVIFIVQFFRKKS
ncbi:hypothetical protein BXU11_01700 [Flavobacterium sp. LM5]|nr:hypothetical protein BXU11_01700 [Flavobacterium sp. LM5]